MSNQPQNPNVNEVCSCVEEDDYELDLREHEENLTLDEHGWYGSPRISSEYPDCSLPLTFDQYSYCSMRCKYCFAFYQKSMNPAMRKNGVSKITLKGVNVDKLIKTFKGEFPDDPYYKNFLSKKFPFHWGGLADPFDGVEKRYQVGYKLLQALVEINYPVIFSTKGVLPTEEPYYSLFKEAAKNKNFAFQFSIIANDDKLSEEIDAGVPVTSERLKCMEAMAKLGYWTVLRLRPFIIGISDINVEELITRAANAGAKAISTEFYCFDVRCNNNDRIVKRFKEISEICGFDMIQYYKDLSPSERGGYRRLNRDVKESYIKRMFTTCRKVGMQFNVSDPDFKELNDSGSCCGLPETREQYDSDLVNWTKGQLTYHLKELRKRYWASGGKDKYLTIEQVIGEASKGWMAEPDYYKDSLKNWATCWGKVNMGYKDEFTQTWNNLDSNGNPYNYFHGKIKPAYRDENDNLVFEYVPHDYERRWAAEGIL